MALPLAISYVQATHVIIPFPSSSVSGAARLNTTCETTVSLPEDSDEQQEVIEVQILPQVPTIQVVPTTINPSHLPIHPKRTRSSV